MGFGLPQRPVGARFLSTILYSLCHIFYLLSDLLVIIPVSWNLDSVLSWLDSNRAGLRAGPEPWPHRPAWDWPRPAQLRTSPGTLIACTFLNRERGGWGEERVWARERKREEKGKIFTQEYCVIYQIEQLFKTILIHELSKKQTKKPPKFYLINHLTFHTHYIISFYSSKNQEKRYVIVLPILMLFLIPQL